MKKLNLFLSLILILVMGTVAGAQTVDDVISKANAAMGGLAAIEDVKSIRMNLTGTFMGKEMEMEVAILKPNNKLIRMKVADLDLDITTATDGTDYWRCQNGKVTDMTVSAKEQFGSSFHQYSGTSVDDLIGNGTFTYTGKENVDGISADVVKGVMTGSGEVSIYFDEAGLPFKMWMPTEEGDLYMAMTDYRDVGGMKVAYKFESIANGSPMMASEVIEAEANIEISQSTFAKPAQ